MHGKEHTREAGYLLLEAVVLGMIVLAAAALLGLFARTALLDAESSARTDAALLARERLSVMAAELDAAGTVPDASAVFERNGVVYTVTAETAVTNEMFYDVTLHLSWSVWGRTETAAFVRRMRAHGTAGSP